MFITLRCTHCDQPMTIAPRKPGSRVTCPACGRNVIVPEPENAAKAVAPAVAHDPPAASPALRQSGPRHTGQIGAPVVAPPHKVRSPAATAMAPIAGRSQSSIGSPVEPHRTRPPLPNQYLPSDESLQWSGPQQSLQRVVLPKSAVILTLLLVLAALVCAFFAGFFFGKYGSPGGGAPQQTAAADPYKCSSTLTSLQPGAVIYDC